MQMTYWIFIWSRLHITIHLSIKGLRGREFDLFSMPPLPIHVYSSQVLFVIEHLQLAKFGGVHQHCV